MLSPRNSIRDIFCGNLMQAIQSRQKTIGSSFIPSEPVHLIIGSTRYPPAHLADSESNFPISTGRRAIYFMENAIRLISALLSLICC